MPRPWLVQRHLRVPAVVAAALLWGLTLPALFDPELALQFGSDFVHFYTLGWTALHRAGAMLYLPEALSAAQAALVPASADKLYLPLYPPQTAVVFAVLALLPYAAASFSWLVISAAGYLAVIFLASRSIRFPADRVLLWTAAIAFPPFWYLLLFRQNSIIVLVVLYAGARFLERGKPVLAGFALGFLALKPQFGIPFAVAALYRRELPLIAGAMLSVVVQALIAVSVFGPDVIADYVRYLPRLLASANAVEPVLYKSLSLRTLFRLVPDPVGQALWTLTCVVVLLGMLRVCGKQVPVRQYLAVVILASVLVNPHVYVYDGIVLALSFLWLGEWRAVRGQGHRLVLPVLGFLAATWLMMPATLIAGPAAGIAATAAAIMSALLVYAASVRDLSAQFALGVASPLGADACGAAGGISPDRQERTCSMTWS